MSDLPMIVNLGVFALGVVLLIAGGEALVRGAVAMAARFGVSPLVIGLTVVAFGTSAPELALNVAAAISGNSDLSFGNIVGSNIANIGLILGLAALIQPMAVKATLVRREIPLMIGATTLFISLGYVELLGGATVIGLSRLDGVILLGGFVAVFGFLFLLSRLRGSDSLLTDDEIRSMEAAKDIPTWKSLAFFFAGLALLMGGGKLAEVGAVGVAIKLGMSTELIGLTIVAVATSLPELATSLMAARRGQVDIAVGNVVGSNIFNLLLVMGVTSVVTPVPLPALAMSSLIMMALLSVLLWPMGLTANRTISRVEGGVLLALYLGYMGYEVVMALTRA